MGQANRKLPVLKNCPCIHGQSTKVKLSNCPLITQKETLSVFTYLLKTEEKKYKLRENKKISLSIPFLYSRSFLLAPFFPLFLSFQMNTVFFFISGNLHISKYLFKPSIYSVKSIGLPLISADSFKLSNYLVTKSLITLLN